MQNNYNPFLKVNEFNGTIDARRLPFSKSFDFTPWGGIEGFLEASRGGQTGYNNVGSQYRVFVPDILRAADMTANAVASLPFDIVSNTKEKDPKTGKEKNKVLDSSGDWKNVLGGMPDPKGLIYRITSSLCGGAAYVIPEGTDTVTINLRYTPPGTILPQYNRDGIFKYGYTSQFGASDTYELSQIIPFFLPDHDVEEGPAKAHPFGAAMSAAWRSMAMNNAINVQSERGFIAPTVMLAEGLIPSEREKAETWWNLWLKGGIRGVLAKVLNAKTLTVQRVGSGMDELKTVFMELKRDASEEVGKAFGIPAGLFMSDAAFASEYNALIRVWYSSSMFVTIYQTIESTLTRLYYSKFDAAMVYRPETIDAFQEDENARGQTVSILVDAVDKNPKAAAWAISVLGYDMTAEQQSQLDEIISEKDTQAEQNRLMQEEALNKPAEPVEKPAPQFRAVVLSPDEMKDLALWYDKAKAWHKRGKSAADWESKHLRQEIVDSISAKLQDAKTMDAIEKAFVINEAEEKKPTEDYRALVEAINKAVEMDNLRQPPANIVINQTQPKRRVRLADVFEKSAHVKNREENPDTKKE